MKTVVLIALAITCAPLIMGGFHQAPPTHAPPSLSPGCGGISGYVFDSGGKPVTNAEVYAEIVNDAPFVGRRPTAETDKDGRFFIKDASPGLNRLYALKEEEGYPDTSYRVYRTANSPPPPEILVTEGRITEGVVIRFGQKCETLLGTILDVDTLQPVKYAKVTFYSPDDPLTLISSGSGAEGKFETLLPPVSVNIKVSAQDYNEVSGFSVQALLKSTYSGDGSKKLNEITIYLRRSK